MYLLYKPMCGLFEAFLSRFMLQLYLLSYLDCPGTDQPNYTLVPAHNPITLDTYSCKI